MNKFDRILWRINGVIFLVFLLFLFFAIMSNFSGAGMFGAPARKNVPGIIKGKEGARAKEVLHPGQLSRVTGTSYLRIPVESEATFSGSSFGSRGERAHTRNVLILDYSDLSSWWLFETFDRAILNEHNFWAAMEENKKRVISTIFEVATTDTDGDSEITKDDHPSLFFSGADGRKVTEIVPAVDRIISVDQVTNDQIMVVYQRGQILTAALFSTQDGAKIKESPLPIRK